MNQSPQSPQSQGTPGIRIAESIRARSAAGEPALIPFITAGFPTKKAFADILRSLAPHAATIEIGVPFTDPMADGVTVQRTSRIALENGVTLQWILNELRSLRSATQPLTTPVVLMGYLNPFLNFGFDRLADACAAAAVDALIIPDLPLEEAQHPGGVLDTLHTRGIGLVQLVSPVTPAERATRIAAASDGFLYAVTTTGVTGSAVPVAQVTSYLDRLRAARGDSSIPICAGFGIRSADHVRALAGHADGVVVGSVLMEELEAGRDPALLLKGLAG